MPQSYSNNLMVYRTLTGLGVPPKTAAGAVGSLMGEAGTYLNNNARNPGDGADGSDSLGWGQWNGSRARALQNTAAQMGTSWNDPRAMVAHIQNELTGPYKNVLASLKSTDDIAHGNNVWTRQYEVPADAGKRVIERQGNGEKFYQIAQGGSGDYGALSDTPMSIRSPGALGMGPQGLQVGNVTAGMPEQPMTLPTAGSLSMSTGIGSGSLGSSTGGGILDGIMKMAGGGGQAQAEEPSDHAETHKAMLARANQSNNVRQLMAQEAQRRAQKDAMVLANQPILS